MKTLLALLLLTGCSNLTPAQRTALTTAETRGANLALDALNAYLDSIAGGGAAGKSIVPVKSL